MALATVVGIVLNAILPRQQRQAGAQEAEVA
jgi:uracil permease